MTPTEKIGDLCCPEIEFGDTSVLDALTYLRQGTYRLGKEVAAS